MSQKIEDQSRHSSRDHSLFSRFREGPTGFGSDKYDQGQDQTGELEAGIKMVPDET
jgi:hypothetical protein